MEGAKGGEGCPICPEGIKIPNEEVESADEQIQIRKKEVMEWQNTMATTKSEVEGGTYAMTVRCW